MNTISTSIIQEAKLQKAQKSVGVSFSSIFNSEVNRLNPKLESNVYFSLDKDLKDASNTFVKLFEDKKFNIFPKKENNVLTLDDKFRTSFKDNIASHFFSYKPTQSYGYSVDSNGFLGEDFNKAANLPSDFKLHISTLNEIERREQMLTLPTFSIFEQNPKFYERIDMADTIKHQFRIFSQAMAGRDKENLPLAISLDGFKQTGYVTYDLSNTNVNKVYDYVPSEGAVKVGFKFEYEPNGYKHRDLNFDMSKYEKDSEESLFVAFMGGTSLPKISDSANTKISKEYKEKMLIQEALDSFNYRENASLEAIMKKTNLDMQTILKHLGMSEAEYKNKELAIELAKNLAANTFLENNDNISFQDNVKRLRKRVQI